MPKISTYHGVTYLGFSSRFSEQLIEKVKIFPRYGKKVRISCSTSKPVIGPGPVFNFIGESSIKLKTGPGPTTGLRTLLYFFARDLAQECSREVISVRMYPPRCWENAILGFVKIFIRTILCRIVQIRQKDLVLLGIGSR